MGVWIRHCVAVAPRAPTLASVRVQALWRGCKARVVSDRRWLSIRATIIQTRVRKMLGAKRHEAVKVELGRETFKIQVMFQRAVFASGPTANSLPLPPVTTTTTTTSLQPACRASPPTLFCWLRPAPCVPYSPLFSAPTAPLRRDAPARVPRLLGAQVAEREAL